MSATNKTPIENHAVVLDTSIAKHPRLVVEMPPEQEETVRDALEALLQIKTGISAQTIVLDALRIAAEQTYFWTPEWRAKEQAAEKAIAEGRVRTFNAMEEMLDFLDAQ